MTRYFQTAQQRGCLLVLPWQIHGHFSWKQSTWLKVSPDQWWRGSKTHWFSPLHHPHPTDIISYTDFCNVLKECPLSLWPPRTQPAGTGIQTLPWTFLPVCRGLSLSGLNWEQGLFCDLLAFQITPSVSLLSTNRWWHHHPLLVNASRK